MLMSSIVRRRDTSWIDLALGGMMTSLYSHHAHQLTYLTDESYWLHVWSWCDQFHMNWTDSRIDFTSLTKRWNVSESALCA